MEKWSQLTLSMLPVLDSLAPRQLTDKDRDFLELQVADYGLNGPNPPDWMIELFRDILKRKTSRPRRCVPNEIPLACVLVEIQDELFPLGVDDYGEGLCWALPTFGVRLVIIRETRALGSLVHLERLKGRTGPGKPPATPVN